VRLNLIEAISFNPSKKSRAADYITNDPPMMFLPCKSVTDSYLGKSNYIFLKLPSKHSTPPSVKGSLGGTDYIKTERLITILLTYIAI
jgi:hypothetical protein